MSGPHGTQAPSPWVQRWTPLIQSSGIGGPRVLDLACGHGRHTRWLASQGCRVTALDRDAAALASLQDLTNSPDRRATTLLADVENGPWPLEGQQFDAVVVTHYLWRPLWPVLLAAVRPGGLLIYETFATGNETVGKPSRPDFLLRHGELLEVCAGWRVVAFEDGYLSDPPRYIQRIVAVRPGTDHPGRHPLGAG
ncbi:MAG: class I SAM-dependent methyltransferase [Serpentinimonas sp.]|jgi:SAM-dependent methyltransferase|nr:class I SAM-dependent methyltransferase [Serpentinimonas sp.]